MMRRHRIEMHLRQARHRIDSDLYRTKMAVGPDRQCSDVGAEPGQPTCWGKQYCWVDNELVDPCLSIELGGHLLSGLVTEEAIAQHEIEEIRKTGEHRDPSIDWICAERSDF